MNNATTTLKTPGSHPSQADDFSNCVVTAACCSPTRRMPSNTLVRLIRRGFSDEEWARLSAQADFVARVNLAASVDDADVVIRYGAELIEDLLPRPDSPAP